MERVGVKMDIYHSPLEFGDEQFGKGLTLAETDLSFAVLV